MSRIENLKLRYENWEGHLTELPYGWAGELDDFNPNEKAFDHDRYSEIIQWIVNNIENPYNNVHWKYIGGKRFRFRRKKDMEFFILRWA